MQPLAFEPRSTKSTSGEMLPDVCPLRREHAEDVGVADGDVATREVVPDDAVFLGAERRDRTLRRKVEVVGPQPNNLALEGVEGVLEEQ